MMNIWKVEHYPYTNGSIAITDCNNEVILIFRNPTQNNLRNSKLIAAAPSMLEALIDCQMALEVSGHKKELEIVRKAIKEAMT